MRRLVWSVVAGATAMVAGAIMIALGNDDGAALLVAGGSVGVPPLLRRSALDEARWWPSKDPEDYR